MITDDEIRACFPYPTFRPGQLEFIREAVHAFEGGAKNVIVEAPTGTGKTPAIICIARLFTRGFDKALKEAAAARMAAANDRDGLEAAQGILGPHQAHMITSLKMLQDQYLRDDKLVQIMKGKNNYLCHGTNAGLGMSCADHEGMFGHVCSKNRRRPCAYIEARTRAQLSRLTLHNFDSFLNQVSLGGAFSARAVLSVDEAHGADDHMISAVSFELSADMLRKLDIDSAWTLPASVDNEADVCLWLKAHDKNLEARGKELNAEIESIQSKLENAYIKQQEEKTLASFARKKKAIDDIRRRLGRYLTSWDKVPWSVERKDSGGLLFEPVKSAPFTKSALLDYGKHRLFMSATIFDNGRRLMSALALKRDETHYISAPCIFPVAHRPLVDMAVADTGQSGYEQAKPAVFAAITRILDTHAGQCGVIHCNSYAMAKDIAKNVASPRLMFHESSTRESVVDAFVSRKRPDAVLVGVFLREGYDFKDDIARFQVLVRLPYAWPDKRTKMRDDMEPGYYDWLAAIDLVQTVGRGVRNETDYCTTYCLDSRLRRFLKRAGHMMPTWFLEAVTSSPTEKKEEEPWLL